MDKTISAKLILSWKMIKKTITPRIVGDSITTHPVRAETDADEFKSVNRP